MQDAWRKYCDRFKAKHQAMLAPGSPKPTTEINMKGTREEIPQMCRPDRMLEAIRDIEETTPRSARSYA